MSKAEKLQLNALISEIKRGLERFHHENKKAALPRIIRKLKSSRCMKNIAAPLPAPKTD